MVKLFETKGGKYIIINLHFQLTYLLSAPVERGWFIAEKPGVSF
jgi:hypothetical protein